MLARRKAPRSLLSSDARGMRSSHVIDTQPSSRSAIRYNFGYTHDRFTVTDLQRGRLRLPVQLDKPFSRLAPA